MSATDWDHNAWYHRLLLRRVPPGAQRVLDVGCGAGALAGELARRAERVDAVDRDPAMVALARARVPANVAVRQADALTVDLPDGGYDAVLSMSALHHLPLAPALERMAGWLRPGGVLVAVALPRTDLPAELPVELAAVLGHRVLGGAFAAGRALTGRPLLAHPADVRAMPVRDPELTTRQVRATAATVLPGVRVRRLAFWRYELTWTKPLG
ncbi:class I SAM-dependent methyltransferase [Modestobacter versicolor]|uniref:SAM-dependent methyltransferase n=1 Tax=Modestobacter versicolor TaxID=429133 RepID=A0A323V3Z2_9ACTN|nr:class I SAM-dependent methyltransferase [Modestobacter versicolor]MBB3676170.1 SAM-dependent methyltransferase [Modestobacter versicolor]PZA19424.1 class I SAM-dependent methyltransferase [Modestobacter versicolor]